MRRWCKTVLAVVVLVLLAVLLWLWLGPWRLHGDGNAAWNDGGGSVSLRLSLEREGLSGAAGGDGGGGALAWFGGILDSLRRHAGLLLVALLSLAAAMWLIRRYFGRHAGLVERCLAGSLIVHLLLMMVFAGWKMAVQVINEQQSILSLSVDSNNLAEEKLALEIRESVTDLPEIELAARPDLRSPAAPDLDVPDAPELPPAPKSEVTPVDLAFAAAVDPPLPAELEMAAVTPPVAAAAQFEELALEIEEITFELPTESDVDATTELPPLREPDPVVARAELTAAGRASPRLPPVVAPDPMSAPLAASEHARASAPALEIPVPAMAVPEVDLSLPLGSMAGGEVAEPPVELDVGPSAPVEVRTAPATGVIREAPAMVKASVEAVRQGIPVELATMPAKPTTPTVAAEGSLAKVAAPVAAAPAAAADPVDVPMLESLPDLELAEALVLDAPVQAEEPYMLRDPEVRERVIEELGGSDETEKAIRSALDWFTRHQEGDGRWSIRRFGGRRGHDVAATSLAVLCYMGWNASHTNDTPHRKTVSKAMAWLLAQEAGNKDGGGDFRGGGDMYDQGMATIALAEAYGLTADEALRGPVERAVEFIIAAQSGKTGGWRYHPGQGDSDTSVVGWQVLALRSARQAGLEVPDEAFAGAGRWLDHVGGGDHGGRYGYTNKSPKQAMVAEGMFCQQLIGVRREHARMIESAGYIATRLPQEKKPDYYYWYYGALALYQHQGPVWEQWNERIKPILVGSQKTSGGDQGSWDPKGPYGNDSGRAVVTAMATLTLEVYYRYLPMYGGGR